MRNFSAFVLVAFALPMSCDCPETRDDSDTCGPYCGENFDEAGLITSCESVFGPADWHIQQCALRAPPPGCHELSTAGPATCADGTSNPVFCCE